MKRRRSATIGLLGIMVQGVVAAGSSSLTFNGTAKLEKTSGGQHVNPTHTSPRQFPRLGFHNR
jgi:hypothetical protein